MLIVKFLDGYCQLLCLPLSRNWLCSRLGPPWRGNVITRILLYICNKAPSTASNRGGAGLPREHPAELSGRTIPDKPHLEISTGYTLLSQMKRQGCFAYLGQIPRDLHICCQCKKKTRVFHPDSTNPCHPALLPFHFLGLQRRRTLPGSPCRVFPGADILQEQVRADLKTETPPHPGGAFPS